MKRFFSALCATVLGLGIAAGAVSAPAFATGLPSDATAVPSSSLSNKPVDWQTLPGETCVKYEPVAAPYTLVAAPANRTYSKLIIKSGNAGSSVVYENYVWYPPNIVVGAQYQHQEKDSNSHLILCTIPTPPTPIVIGSVPTATPPDCFTAGTLVLPVVAHVSWTGGTNGAGPGTYTITAVPESGYTISGQSVFVVEVLAQLQGSYCDQVIQVDPVPSATDPDCENDGTLVLPEIDHISWTGGSHGDGPGSYTITAVPDLGYTISGQTVFEVEVLEMLEGEECDEEIRISFAPFATEPDCDSDGTLVLPVIPHVSWTGGTNGAGPGSYTITAVAATGYTIVGQSVFEVEVLEQLVEGCDQLADEIGDPEPTDAACATEEGGQSTDGFYTIIEAEGVGYYVYINDVLTETVESTAPFGPVIIHVTSYPSTVKIDAFALPGYYLDYEAQTHWQHTFVFDEEDCNLTDLDLVTPEFGSTGPTCTTNGSYTVGGVNVVWTLGVGGPVITAGTHAVTQAGTITLVAAPGPGHGFDYEQQTTWVVTFGARLECGDLDTLALTGNEGLPLFLGGAASLLLLGAASIFFTRRRSI